MENSWQKISSDLAYEDPWIKLRKHNIIFPSGKNGIYSVVELKGGVGIVAIDQDKMVYLVGQYRFPLDTYSLEIPKGSLDFFGQRDNFLQSAQRELKEETGITANKWEKLNIVHTLMGFSDDLVHLFLATDLVFGDSQLGENEDITLFKIPFDQISNIIKEGYCLANGERIFITDATSIAALLLAKEVVK